MDESVKQILTKIIQHINKINRIHDGQAEKEFFSDSLSTDGCIYNLQQIGELVGRLPNSFTTLHPHIPWRKIQGTRHKLVHDYDHLNLELLWDTIVNHLPLLHSQLVDICSEKAAK